MISALAVMGIFLVGIYAWEFVDGSLEARKLAESGTPVELKLVRHNDERFFKDRGKERLRNQSGQFT